MISKILIVTALLTGMLISTSAQADFVRTDWKKYDDRLAMLDTDTGLEWLKLTQTDGMSIDNVAALFDTTFKGWRLPSHSEVHALALKFFPTKLPSPSKQVGLHNGEGIGMPGYFGYTVDEHKAYDYGSFGRYIRDDGTVSIFGRKGSYVYYDNLTNYTQSWSLGHGVFLVSDGGTTLSSINDPTINGSNPNAPINNVSNPNAPINNVSAPAGLGLVMFMGLLALRRARTATIATTASL